MSTGGKSKAESRNNRHEWKRQKVKASKSQSVEKSKRRHRGVNAVGGGWDFRFQISDLKSEIWNLIFDADTEQLNAVES